MSRNGPKDQGTLAELLAGLHSADLPLTVAKAEGLGR